MSRRYYSQKASVATFAGGIDGEREYPTLRPSRLTVSYMSTPRTSSRLSGNVGISNGGMTMG